MSSLWIFGYGSLLFRPDFEHVRSEVAWAEGFVRRFHQGSTDHRGVPEAPGRVVTLVPAPGGRVGGLAFEVPAHAIEAVVAKLDHRERGGYERLELVLTDATGAPRPHGAVTYVATPENPNWLGDAPLETIAAEVATAEGPSGRNVDYVLALDRTLRDLGIEDAHVAALAALVARR